MESDDKNSSDQLRLTDLEVGVGHAVELSAQERARLTLAVRVLAALGLVVVLAAYVLIYGPSERLDEAKAVFDFVKTVAPPIATLVIGFYFRGESGQ